MSDLQGRNVLVTGGGLRIGRAISTRLADAGFGVVIQYRNSKADAEDTVATIRADGGAAWSVASTLADADACERLLADAETACGGLWGLVNNAASFKQYPLAETTEARLHDEMRINLYAPVLLTRGLAALPSAGCVINLLDRRVAANPGGCAAYLLAKQGLATFTRCAAVELAPRIRVGGVAPGPILPPPGESPDYLAASAGTIPLAACPSADDVAAAVHFLLDATSVTGQVIFVDGGQHLLGNGV